MSAGQPGNPGPVQVGNGMANGFPVYKIAGMGYRNAWEMNKSGVHHVIVLSNTHNRRIGIESAPDRIAIAFISCESQIILQPLSCLSSLGEIQSGQSVAIAPQRIHTQRFHSISCDFLVSTLRSIMHHIASQFVCLPCNRMGTAGKKRKHLQITRCSNPAWNLCTFLIVQAHHFAASKHCRKCLQIAVVYYFFQLLIHFKLLVDHEFALYIPLKEVYNLRKGFLN